MVKFQNYIVRIYQIIVQQMIYNVYFHHLVMLLIVLFYGIIMHLLHLKIF
jgi:hypothetical protein